MGTLSRLAATCQAVLHFVNLGECYPAVMAQRWCSVCGKSLTGRKVYCSGACKQRAWRQANALLPIIVMSGRSDREGETPGESTCGGDDGSNARGNKLPLSVTNRNADALLYSALQKALHKHAATGGTAVGTLQVVQRIFLSMGYDGLTYRAPLPRLNRAVREALGTYNEQKRTDAAIRAAWLKGYEQGKQEALGGS
jgi:predicted nucleic acid-binding Zn ribbon protein